MQYIWNNFTFPSFQTNIRVEQGSFLSSILLALYLASVLRTWEKRINNLSIPIPFIAVGWVSDLLEHEVSVWSVQNWGVRKICAGRHTCLLINQKIMMRENRDEIIVHRGHIQQSQPLYCLLLIICLPREKLWENQCQFILMLQYVCPDVVEWHSCYGKWHWVVLETLSTRAFVSDIYI